MTTIILAAGYGTRLYPLTLNKPKALLEVGGKTILERIVENIELIKECTKICIVTNEKFHKSFEDWGKTRAFSTEIEVINDGTKTNETRLGAIADINLVVERKNIKDDLFILGSDNLFEVDLREFTQFGFEKKPSSSIMLVDIKKKRLAKKYGICSVDKDSKVTDFEEKPEKPKNTLAASAVYFIPKEKVAKISDYMKTDLPKDAPGNLMKWLAKVDKLFGHVIRGTWYDIGDIKSLKKADEEFTKKEKK
ncbi:MAG: nucleotidyltransferase family protein [Candidatus Omnitrophica bacterium]|nr:nucleotidyltransferase family protein [Candidatus Omnitrophota bacterium]